MTDKELLELAAKAAGMGRISNGVLTGVTMFKTDGGWVEWNPLEQDSNALRLAVKLKINLQHSAIADNPSIASIECGQWSGLANDGVPWVEEVEGLDPYAATRRAITRAAAEIGRVSQ